MEHAPWPAARVAPASDGPLPGVGVTNAATTTTSLSFNNISMVFPDGTEALKNITFSVDRGQFVTVVVETRDATKSIVVPQAAIQEDQQGPFMLVVNADDQVEARHIETGPVDGTDRVVRSGLNVGETVIVEGLQKVRPGVAVNPVLQSASTTESTSSDSTSSGADSSDTASSDATTSDGTTSDGTTSDGTTSDGTTSDATTSDSTSTDVTTPSSNSSSSSDTDN